MKKSEYEKISKFLSYILRHKPDSINLELDSNGWANINDLICKTSNSKKLSHLDFETIKEIVNTSDKKRFTLNKDETKIKANQGHSLSVDLELEEREPPEFLFHGTAKRFLGSILKDGLKPMKRQHVHMTTNVDTATEAGSRYGECIMLKINTLTMYKEGYKFFLSANNVWLTNNIPPKYFTIE